MSSANWTDWFTPLVYHSLIIYLISHQFFMSGKDSSEQHGIGCSSSKTNAGFSTNSQEFMSHVWLKARVQEQGNSSSVAFCFLLALGHRNT